MPNGWVIGFAGKARVGKSTAALMLDTWMTSQGWRVMHRGIGDGIREELARATGVEPPAQTCHRRAWRRLWQEWGAMRRRECGREYWIDQWHATVGNYMRMYRPNAIVVSDVRLEEEPDLLRRRAGAWGFTTLFIRVTRPWYAREWVGWEVCRDATERGRVACDYILHNSGGHEDLRRRVAVMGEDCGIGKPKECK